MAAERVKIELTDSLEGLIIKMSEGNPGAITVLAELTKAKGMDVLWLILGLDDMNIRGSQIWVGFKDHCGGDAAKFEQAIKDRDPEMVATINRACPDWVATTGGSAPGY